MSLTAYRERVEKLARQRTGVPIYNGSIEHAQIIIEKVFAHASKYVHILSGTLNARTYGPKEVMEQVRLFLSDKGHEVKIIIEDKSAIDFEEHPFFHEFLDKENVQVRIAPEGLQGTYEFHFLVMDGDSYRFEPDKREHAAIASFGDKDGARNLESIFGDLWEQSEPLSIQQINA